MDSTTISMNNHQKLKINQSISNPQSNQRYRLDKIRSLAALGLIMLTPEAKANNIPELDFLCTPCINFGGFYCYDDPWKVNFNGDKCYEYAVDRLNCDNFKFTNDINDCIQGKL